MAGLREKDIAGVRIPPPLLFFICLGVSGACQYLFPLSLLRDWVPVRFAAGILLSSLSGMMALGAFWVMGRHQTPFDPAKPTRAIVTKGVFRYSRNPMYTALLLLQAAAAAATGSAWMALGGLVLWWLLRQTAVIPEEKYLTEKFGERYLSYKKSVRRWI